MNEKAHIDTRIIRAGEARPAIEGAVVMPVFQTAMYLTEGDAEYHDIPYIRLNNTPNQRVLHEKLASLENAEAALVTSSGMAAIFTSLIAVLSSGDHLLAQDCLYGGTHSMLRSDFPAMNIDVDIIDGTDPDSWESKLRPTTRAIYIETITNPLMGVPELEAVVRFARTHGLVSLIDNTFASPVNFRPPETGFDVSLHSCTKYLNGHSDIVAGAVIGSGELVDRIRHKLNHTGGTLDPHACFLLHRGMKTLGLRIRRQNESALAIARFLERHEAVSTVNYPGLESSPDHARASAALDGFGGMLSFELVGGMDAADSLLGRAQIPLVAPSLGGVETLLTLPARTSHRGLSPDERREVGIADGLVRMSVGIESTEDLIDDLRQALES